MSAGGAWALLGPLGPWWVAKLLGATAALGILAALIARARGQPFWPWAFYGVSLPVVALPHALTFSRAPAAAIPFASASARPLASRVLDWLALRPKTAVMVAVLAVTNLVLVNWHRELFGAAWQYVMWEGGYFEGLTPINFLLGALVFVLAAHATRGDPVRRAWLLVYAFADVVLAGEEISWGTGQILLDLNDPSFESKYNSPTTLHHFLPGVGPIIIFFVIVAIFRLAYPIIRARLKAPMAVGFLNAVLLTLLVVPFMNFEHSHYLFFDEVYEWSGSVLLLHLALYERWHWSFTR